MKFKHITIVLVLGLCFPTFAQSIESGDKRRDWGWQPQSSINFFGFNSERGIADNVTLGFSLMLSNPGKFDYLSIYLLPSIRGNYYVTELLNLDEDKIDIYGGLGLSKNLHINDFYDDFNIDLDYPVSIQLNAGGRYFISDRFGFKAELNVGRLTFTNFTAGLFLSFKK